MQSGTKSNFRRNAIKTGPKRCYLFVSSTDEMERRSGRDVRAARKETPGEYSDIKCRYVCSYSTHELRTSKQKLF